MKGNRKMQGVFDVPRLPSGDHISLLIAYCIFFPLQICSREILPCQLKSVSSFGEYCHLDSLQNKRADSPFGRTPGACEEERGFCV